MQALAEKREQRRSAATKAAASTWRQRALLDAAGGAAAAGATAKQPTSASGGLSVAALAHGREGAADGAGGWALEGEEDMLTGAVSVGGTPRAESKPKIVAVEGSGVPAVEQLRKQIAAKVQRRRAAGRAAAVPESREAAHQDGSTDQHELATGARTMAAVAGESGVLHHTPAPGGAGASRQPAHSHELDARERLFDQISRPAGQAQLVRMVANALITASKPPSEESMEGGSA